MINFSSLAKPAYRLVGLAICMVGILIFILLKLLNYNYMDGWEEKIFIINHYIIIFGFMMIAFSKETHEEHTKS